MMLMAGCTTKSSVCPTFPNPTKEQLEPIRELNNDKVDLWIIELFKLKQKLKVCNES